MFIMVAGKDYRSQIKGPSLGSVEMELELVLKIVLYSQKYKKITQEKVRMSWYI